MKKYKHTSKKKNTIRKFKTRQANKDPKRALKRDRPKDPQVIVFSRGDVGKDTEVLVENFRRMLAPNSTDWIKRNKIKDIPSIASHLHYTHMVVFSETDKAIYLRLCRLPQGPTVTFRVKTFTYSSEVAALQRKQFDAKSSFLTGPCLMTNLQPDDGPLQLQLTAKMFLDMFPTIAPNKASTDSIQRCCFIHHDPDSAALDFRHYFIRTVPVGVSKAVKKITQRKLPDLGRFANMSEFMDKSGMLSESEAEDDPASEVTLLDQKVRPGRPANARSAVRLTELGPRIELEVRKIETGLMEGEVLYHNLVQKTAKEKVQLEQRRERKKDLRIQRRREQEKNVEAKRKQLEDHKEKCLKGMGVKKPPKKQDDEDEDQQGEDDADYYKDEIGEAPDAALFDKVDNSKKRKSGDEGWFKRFKRKKDGDAADGGGKGKGILKAKGGKATKGKKVGFEGDFKHKGKNGMKGGKDFKGKGKNMGTQKGSKAKRPAVSGKKVKKGSKKR